MSDRKISSVEAYHVRLWAHSRQGALPRFASDDDPARGYYRGPFAQLAGAIVAIVSTNDGVRGFGLGGGGRPAVEIIRGHLTDLLLGTNPLDIETRWSQLYQAGEFYGRRGVFVMALSGIDNALWDLAGKCSGRPVYRLLGEDPASRVPGYATGGNVDAAIEHGFRHFKFNPPADLRHGTEGMRRNTDFMRDMRRAIGEDALLMIDCGARWDDVEYVLEAARRLEDVRVHWIEEPLQPDDLDGYARLVAEIEGPAIASGEHEFTHYGFAELIRRRAAGILQPDVSWSGGVTALRRISGIAADHGLPFIPHRGGSLFGLPLALNAPHCPLAESFGTIDEGTDLMAAMTAPFEDGCYLPVERPGFGTDLTEKLISEHAIRD